MSYDEKCEELARHFLDDQPNVTEAQVKELAEAIQITVETYLELFRV